ncbi:MAG: 6-carboxytetrahydropterin synthase QueD, partial [Coriobacteriia bacterium]|nr:6-carboxytetrahydropterin synthase QueD [Coriobacteriia bacterium]
ANEAMDGRCLVGDYASAPNEGLFGGHCAETDTLIGVGPGEAVPAMSVHAMPADGAGAVPAVDVVGTAHTDAVAAAAPAADAGATGTYGLSVKSHFDAAHHLYDYPGECRALHGHTWDVEVTVESSELDEIGLVYDFKSLKADLAAVLHDYDHALINEIAPFDKVSPTAENLARVICERLQTVVSPRVRVKEVAVWESPVAKLVYRPKVP